MDFLDFAESIIFLFPMHYLGNPVWKYVVFFVVLKPIQDYHGNLTGI